MCVRGLRLCFPNSAITYWWGPDWMFTCTPTSIYTFLYDCTFAFQHCRLVAYDIQFAIGFNAVWSGRC